MEKVKRGFAAHPELAKIAGKKGGHGNKGNVHKRGFGTHPELANRKKNETQKGE